MSEHVRDRLSALLDRELDQGEREAVESHLEDCATCARDLELLRAVDEEARALPLDAPSGYFDALPGRVRARLEGVPRRRRGLPVWTLALAAALLLAVITPLTLRRAPPLEMSQDRREPAAPAGSVPAAPLAAAPADEERPENGAPARRDQPASGGAEAGFALKRQDADVRKDKAPAAEPKRPIEGDRPGSFAEGKLEKSDSLSAQSLSVERERPAPARSRAQGAPGGPSGQAQAPLQAPSASPPAFAAPPPASAAANDALTEAQSQETARDETAARRRNEAGAVAEKSKPMRQGRVERSFGAAEESLYERLKAPVPASLDALRTRREEWRSYSQDFASSPRADEARVRVVETGAEAWRVGRDAADLARAREDATAYLARADAAQAPRVRAILESLPEKP
jgi:hypothetical protein